MVALYKKHSPKTFQDVVGQDKVLKRLLILSETTGLQGQVFWITGESGTGKSVIADLIADQTADPNTTYKIDALDVSIDTLRGWEDKCQYRGLFGAYTFVINEAHNLSKTAVSRLQTLLEDDAVQKNSTWVFTTTNKGNEQLFDKSIDSCPFLSRAVCFQLQFDAESIAAMAERVMEIARIEKVDGKPLEDYIHLMIECKGNMRRALQEVASGAMIV